MLEAEPHWLQQSEEDVSTCDDWLSGDEAIVLRGLRFAKRRSDWRLGRWTAKCAVAAYLKLPTAPASLDPRCAASARASIAVCRRTGLTSKG